MTTLGIPPTFQDVLREHLPYAEDGELDPTSDLTNLGLDSMSIVELLGDLEAAFDLELPDEILNEATFATVGSLWLAVDELIAAKDSP